MAGDTALSAAGDAELCRLIGDGDQAALAHLVIRHHTLATFCVTVLGDPSTDATRLVEAAWRDVMPDITCGRLEGSVVEALLRRLIGPVEGGDEQPPARTHYDFLEEDDRWAGWWREEPQPWAPDVAPTPQQVVTALRRMPGRQRTVLVLRDVAHLDAESTAALLGLEMHVISGTLRHARDSYLAELDSVMTA